MKICICGREYLTTAIRVILGLNPTLDILLSEAPYFMGSTTTAVPYARTSVTPCMTSVAS